MVWQHCEHERQVTVVSENDEWVARYIQASRDTANGCADMAAAIRTAITALAFTRERTVVYLGFGNPRVYAPAVPEVYAEVGTDVHLCSPITLNATDYLAVLDTAGDYGRINHNGSMMSGETAYAAVTGMAGGKVYAFEISVPERTFACPPDDHSSWEYITDRVRIYRPEGSDAP